MQVRSVLAMMVLVGLKSAAAADGPQHAQLIRATVKLAHEKSTATGFVLTQERSQGPRQVLVTAAHVLENTVGPETTLVYRNRDMSGAWQKQSLPLRIRNENQPLWTRHPTDDVAVLEIALPAEADLPGISPDVLATDGMLQDCQIDAGHAIWCLGYPHRTEANALGFPILRQGVIGSYPVVPSAEHRTFLFSGNTFEGDSGGPVYTLSPQQGGRLVILGLMHGQHFLNEDMTMVYGSTRLKHRLGLGIVVQAALIRETLQQLP